MSAATGRRGRRPAAGRRAGSASGDRLVPEAARRQLAGEEALDPGLQAAVAQVAVAVPALGVTTRATSAAATTPEEPHRRTLPRAAPTGVRSATAACAVRVQRQRLPSAACSSTPPSSPTRRSSSPAPRARPRSSRDSARRGRRRRPGARWRTGPPTSSWSRRAARTGARPGPCAPSLAARGSTTPPWLGRPAHRRPGTTPARVDAPAAATALLLHAHAAVDRSGHARRGRRPLATSTRGPRGRRAAACTGGGRPRRRPRGGRPGPDVRTGARRAARRRLAQRAPRPGRAARRRTTRAGALDDAVLVDLADGRPRRVRAARRGRPRPRVTELGADRLGAVGGRGSGAVGVAAPPPGRPSRADRASHVAAPFGVTVTPSASLAAWHEPRWSSRSSARPRPASPTSGSRSPRPWPARWSTPTPCSSTAAWTSAPPSCPPTSGAASRTTCSTCSTPHEDASVADYQDRGPGRLRRDRGSRASGRRRRRLGALRAGAARPHGVPGHRPGACAPRSRTRVEAEGARALHAELAAARPGRRRRHRPAQRPADRARARGHRDHRPPVLRQPPAARLRGAGGADRPGLRPRGAGRADRGTRRRGCGRAGSSTRCAALVRARPGPDRVARRRLRRGPRDAPRRAHAGRGARTRSPPARGGWPASRWAGSAGTRGCTGSTRRTRTSSTRALGARRGRRRRRRSAWPRRPGATT